mgnify:CR=1 FL=1
MEYLHCHLTLMVIRLPQNSVFFIIVPYFIFGFTYWLEVNLDNIIDTLLSVLSIFTALIFGVLFTVPDKLPHRIEKLNQKKKIMLLKIT